MSNNEDDYKILATWFLATAFGLGMCDTGWYQQNSLSWDRFAIGLIVGTEILRKMAKNMGSSKKSCSKGILESCGLPGAKRIFAMDHFCANFQDIW